MMIGRRRLGWTPLAAGAVVLVVAGGLLLFFLWGGTRGGSEAVRPLDVPAEAEFGELRGLPEPTAGATASAAPEELGGEPFRTCVECHPDYLEQPSATGDLIFSHRTHLENQVLCATCHQPPLGHFDTPAPMMMTCLSCHQGETAPNDCQNCHRKIDEIAPGLSEPVVHLEPDAKTRTTCEKCHDVQVWCEQCHGVEMPHPAGWQRAHGRPALSESRVCEKCHQSRDKTFCIRCHGVEMPHPAYWYSGHGDIARQSESSCIRCHPQSPQFCNQCHHAGFAPTAQWLPSQHGTVVSDQGTSTCFVCHEPMFCERCHERGRFIRQ